MSGAGSSIRRLMVNRFRHVPPRISEEMRRHQPDAGRPAGRAKQAEVRQCPVGSTTSSVMA